MLFGGMAIFRPLGNYLGLQNGTLRNEISALIKRDMGKFISLGKMSKKIAIYKPGNRFSPDTGFLSALILDFQAFTAVRKKCLLLKPSSLQYYCYRSLNQDIQVLQRKRNGF